MGWPCGLSRQAPKEATYTSLLRPCQKLHASALCWKRRPTEKPLSYSGCKVARIDDRCNSIGQAAQAKISSQSGAISVVLNSSSARNPKQAPVQNLPAPCASSLVALAVVATLFPGRGRSGHVILQAALGLTCLVCSRAPSVHLTAARARRSINSFKAETLEQRPLWRSGSQPWQAAAQITASSPDGKTGELAPRP